MRLIQQQTQPLTYRCFQQATTGVRTAGYNFAVTQVVCADEFWRRKRRNCCCQASSKLQIEKLPAAQSHRQPNLTSGKHRCWAGDATTLQLGNSHTPRTENRIRWWCVCSVGCAWERVGGSWRLSVVWCGEPRRRRDCSCGHRRLVVPWHWCGVASVACLRRATTRFMWYARCRHGDRATGLSTTAAATALSSSRYASCLPSACCVLAFCASASPIPDRGPSPAD